MSKTNKNNPTVLKYKAVRAIYDKALQNLREGYMPALAVHRALNGLRCPQCKGVGAFTEIETDRGMITEFHCELCKRTGVTTNE